MRAIWGRLAKLLGAIVIAGIAVLAVGQVWNGLKARQDEFGVARRDQLEIARMTREMRTLCLGRFLIDLPEEANVELREMRIDGFDIVSFDEPDTDFLARLAQRETRLRTAPDRPEGGKNLDAVREVKTGNGVAGKIFVHGRTVSEGTRLRGQELARYRLEGIAVEALVHADGVSYEIGADDYDPDHIEDLPKLLEKLVPNRGNRAPTGPGFCVHNAWVRDPLTADQNERLMMNVKFPTHPDIVLRMDVMAGATPQGQGLLERIAGAYERGSYAEKKRVIRLRAAPRTIDGLAGEEVVDQFDKLNNIFVHHFLWEVAGVADNVLIPSISFTMETGHAVSGSSPPLLSQEAAVALWDKITSSIRLHSRPGRLWPLGNTRQGIGQGEKRP